MAPAPWAYLDQAQRFAKARGQSEAYARGFVALGWLTFVGFLLILALGLLKLLLHRSVDGGIWVVLASQIFIWAGLILPYFYWPRLAMPSHARDDLSPFQERRQRRREREH